MSYNRDYYLKKRGEVKFEHKPKEMVAEILRRVREGESKKSVAEDLGIGRSVVQYHCRKEGI